MKWLEGDTSFRWICSKCGGELEYKPTTVFWKNYLDLAYCPFCGDKNEEDTPTGFSAYREYLGRYFTAESCDRECSAARFVYELDMGNIRGLGPGTMRKIQDALFTRLEDTK